MHKVIEKIKENIHIPVLHITDATAKEMKRKGIQTVGLLGTKYTMEQDFYKSRIKENDIKAIVPLEKNREKINRSHIYRIMFRKNRISIQRVL